MIIEKVKKKLNQLNYERNSKKFRDHISIDPLNANLHYDFSVYAFKHGQPFLAFSELKSAEFLGVDKKNISRYKKRILSSLPMLETMNHNMFYRFKTLADELKVRNNESSFTVLDVGGGLGELAAFIPDASYCLVEPSVNGISGTNLPFENKSFDFVVSCHVLEHIPVKDRNLFLDQLLSKSKYGLILLNPFHIEVSSPDKIVFDVTKAEWAKEHLECTLPYIEEIQNYANTNNLQLEIKPNGTITTTLAMIFMDHFYSKTNLKSEWDKVNYYFNNLSQSVLNNDKYPTACLVFIGK